MGIYVYYYEGKETLLNFIILSVPFCSSFRSITAVPIVWQTLFVSISAVMVQPGPVGTVCVITPHHAIISVYLAPVVWVSSSTWVCRISLTFGCSRNNYYFHTFHKKCIISTMYISAKCVDFETFCETCNYFSKKIPPCSG